MAQPRFISQPASATLAEIAVIANARLVDAGRADQRVRGLASLAQAGPIHLTFFDGSRPAADLSSTEAGACLVSETFEAAMPPQVAVLRAADPFRAFVDVACELYRDLLRTNSWFGIVGIAASAVVHPTARLEDGVVIDPLAVVGPGVEIGADTVIGSGAVIGPHVRIGRNCVIGPGCSVQFALIGNSVVIHPGCQIGQSGSGLAARTANGPELPFVGRVLFQHGVEVGAGGTIDRGSLQDTVIGERSKIDSQVRIGHDVTIGRLCRIGAQVGIGAGAVIGDGTELGTAARILGPVRIGDAVTVVPAGIIDHDIAANGIGA